MKPFFWLRLPEGFQVSPGGSSAPQQVSPPPRPFSLPWLLLLRLRRPCPPRFPDEVFLREKPQLALEFLSGEPCGFSRKLLLKMIGVVRVAPFLPAPVPSLAGGNNTSAGSKWEGNRMNVNATEKEYL